MIDLNYPKEWNKVTIKDCCGNGKYGLNKASIDYDNNKPQYIRITDIDNNNNYDKTNKVSVDCDDCAEYVLKEGDLLFARTGATVGKNYLYKKDDGILVYAGFLIKFSINENIVNKKLLHEICNTKKYWDWVKLMSSRSGQPGINAKEFGTYKFILPPLEEQENIAKILITSDIIITQTSELIKEKRKQKKYLMTELLSGNKRLKCFKEYWKKEELNKECEMYAGGTPSTTIKEYWNGQINWLQSGLIQNNIISQSSINKKITELGLKNSATKLIDSNSVVIAITGATCANIGYIDFRTTANQSVISITPKHYNSKFIYYLLMYNRIKLLKLQGGSAQGGITLNDLKKFEISIPSIPEQTAIANILECVDKEIELLESRLDEYKLLKKSLMQLLLTGIVRTV